MTKISGKPEIIKKVNISLIKKAITEKAPISKPQLSKILDLSLPTVNKAVDELLERGIVKVCQNTVETKCCGKKPVFYEINGDCTTVITVYFKNNILSMREYNLLSEIKNEKTVSIENNLTIEKFLEYLGEMFTESKNRENITTVSIGIPGVIEKNNCINGAYSLKNFNGVNLKKIVEEKFKVKAIIENDVNLIAIGFLEKLNPNIKNLVYLFLSKGIGTGIIINNKLYKGKSNFAGEIGEILLFDGESIEEKYKLAIKNNDKEKIKKIITFILIINISVLNPDIIIINSSVFKLEKELLDDIYISLKKKLGENNIPEIYLDEKDIENGIEGTMKMAFLKNSDDFSIVGK